MEQHRDRENASALTRRDILRAAAGLMVAANPAWTLALSRTGQPRKPNIVLIVADDLGYAELGCQGCKDIATKNIDSIAQGGVRFTQGYVTCPICAPTRAALLTGRYQQRFGFETNPGPEAYAEDDFGLPLDQPTLAERLKAAGYATGMVGKWHLGFKQDLTPPNRGFDEFYGFLGGAHRYLPGSPRSDLLRGTTPVHDEKEYLTDAFGREAVAFIRRNKARPFFLYLPFNAVHSPLEASEKRLEGVRGIQDEKRRVFAAMMLAMDDAVGRVLRSLREEGLEENTLIIFLSDNGGPTLQTTSGNAPLRGFKAQVWEGGIRVPFLMQWKGRIPRGKVFEEPVSSLDIVPTVLAAAGIRQRPEDALDGVNLMPHLWAERSGRPHEVLYWRFHEQRAIRKGDWKLVQPSGRGAWQLYDLREDVAETRDRAAEHPDKVRELQKAWEDWNAQLQPPKWSRQDGRARRRPQPNPRGAGLQGGDLNERFRTMDRDGDGRLSPDEVGRPALFRRLDLDGDGFVSLDEAKKALGGT